MPSARLMPLLRRPPRHQFARSLLNATRIISGRIYRISNLRNARSDFESEQAKFSTPIPSRERANSRRKSKSIFAKNSPTPLRNPRAKNGKIFYKARSERADWCRILGTGAEFRAPWTAEFLHILFFAFRLSNSSSNALAELRLAGPCAPSISDCPE